MSWITDNAVKRIFNSFKRLKNQIYEQDIEALKLLNDELVNSQKRYVNDNILFLKLLTMNIRLEAEHFQDIKTAKVNLAKGLSLPLDYHIEKLRLSLNNIDLNNYLKSIGIEPDHLDFSKEKKETDLSIIKEKESEIIEKLKASWTYQKVENSIYNTTNEFLKDINNYN